MAMKRVPTSKLQPQKASGGGSDPNWFEAHLNAIPHGKSILNLRKDGVVYSQGQQADAVYFIQQGKVRLSVLQAPARKRSWASSRPATFAARAASRGSRFA